MTIRNQLPRIAIHRGRLLNGDLFDYDSKQSCHVEAWISINAIVVAYPLVRSCEISNFEYFINQLDSKPRFGHGLFWDGMAQSLYGAKWTDATNTAPTVVWGAHGDWAALFRNLHFAGSAQNAGYISYRVE